MKYFWLTVRHKWFVLLAGLKVGCPLWRLLTHDLSKFLPSELPHYNRQFYGPADDAQGFVLCLNRHQNRNDHHWEWWIPRTGHKRSTPPYPDNEPLEMSDGAVREMVADWMGASRAYEGKWPSKNGGWKWYEQNRRKIFDRLHPATKQKVMDLVWATVRVGPW